MEEDPDTFIMPLNLNSGKLSRALCLTPECLLTPNFYLRKIQRTPIFQGESLRGCEAFRPDGLRGCEAFRPDGLRGCEAIWAGRPSGL